MGGIQKILLLVNLVVVLAGAVLLVDEARDVDDEEHAKLCAAH